MSHNTIATHPKSVVLQLLRSSSHYKLSLCEMSLDKRISLIEYLRERERESKSECVS